MKASTLAGTLVFYIPCYLVPVILILIGVSPFYILAAVAVVGLLCWLTVIIGRAVQKHKTYSSLKQELLHDIEEFEKGKR